MIGTTCVVGLFLLVARYPLAVAQWIDQIFIWLDGVVERWGAAAQASLQQRIEHVERRIAALESEVGLSG
jgi:hypothetical protein